MHLELLLWIKHTKHGPFQKQYFAVEETEKVVLGGQGNLWQIIMIANGIWFIF